jgi:phosphonate transport system ATP-binding protein
MPVITLSHPAGVNGNGRDVIEVKDIAVSYDAGKPALFPTSLAFRAGEFTVLLGASGAGKSTLLRCLNGLVTSNAGRITVSGVPLGSGAMLRKHRRMMGMMFQQHQLIGRQTVLANVLMGRLGFRSSLQALLPYGKADKEMALAAIDRVGLIDHALRRADQLSGGQQQRVGLARALIQKPAVFLADEPVASLDPATAERVLTLIHNIAKQDGLTAIVSLHQVELARRFADRIIALSAGRVVFDGAAAELAPERIAEIYGKTLAGGSDAVLSNSGERPVQANPSIKELAA